MASKAALILMLCACGSAPNAIERPVATLSVHDGLVTCPGADSVKDGVWVAGDVTAPEIVCAWRCASFVDGDGVLHPEASVSVEMVMREYPDRPFYAWSVGPADCR